MHILACFAKFVEAFYETFSLRTSGSLEQMVQMYWKKFSEKATGVLKIGKI